MKALIGILMILGGIVLGLYVGVWLCFIGGIVGVINQIVAAVNGSEVVAMTIAVSVAKIVFAALAGWLSAIILIIPGAALLKD